MAKTPKVSNVKSGAKKAAKLDPADNGTSSSAASSTTRARGFKKVGSNPKGTGRGATKIGTEGGSKDTEWTPPWAKKGK